MGSIDERMGANEAFGQAPARLWANRPIIAAPRGRLDVSGDPPHNAG